MTSSELVGWADRIELAAKESTPGWEGRVIVLESTDSTQDAALRAFAADEPGQIIVLAGSQSAARGRLGRPWHSDQGGLSITIADRHGRYDEEENERLSLSIGLAVQRACSSLIEPRYRSMIRVKPPNDVMFDRLGIVRKLAGVLIERKRSPLTPHLITLIGIGVNVSQNEADWQRGFESLADIAVSLNQIGWREGTSPQRIELADRIIREVGDVQQLEPDRIKLELDAVMLER